MPGAPLPDFVFAWARREPDAEAIVSEKLRLNYRQLAEHIEALRDVLIAGGLPPGARVAHLGLPGPEFLITALATHAAGAVWMGLNPRHTKPELAYVLWDAAPVLVFVEKSVGETAAQACLEAILEMSEQPLVCVIEDLGDLSKRIPKLPSPQTSAPQGVGLIVYTSGTTGQPKGACLTHEGIAKAACLYTDRYAHAGMRSLLNLPINHVGSLIDIVSPSLRAGGCLVTMPGFAPAAIPDLMREERISLLGQVPAMHLAIDAAAPYEPETLPSLRHLVWSGAAMPRAWIEARWGGRVELSTCYGQTEATGSVTFSEPGASIDDLADTVGAAPLPGMLRIANDHGVEVTVGETGEIQVRGAFVMQGYFNRPEATASAFTSDGWLRTGDLGVQDSHGAVRLVGRKSEMYKSGGYNVYPREVEIALEAFPGVDAAAVVSVADDRWQEVGWAFVLSQSNLDEAALTTALRRSLANYKIPKRIVVSSDLPLLPIGKIDKQSLQRAILKGRYDG